jgi:cyclase
MTPSELEPGRIIEVSDGLYAFVQPDGTWMINNTGFLVGADGVALVDTSSTQRRTELLRDAVRQVTPAPIRTLVNTHSHPDHVTGNGLFPAATIVAHERTRAVMLGAPLPVGAIFPGMDAGSLPLTPPFLTYSSGVTLWVGDLRCEVAHVGQPAHTTNDSYLWVPDRRVLFAGDMVFHRVTPFMMFGSVTGAIEVLERVIAPLGATTIVPGHGEICGPEGIEEVLGYLRLVLDLARSAQEAGLEPLEAARQADLGEYADWPDAERIVGNLHRAYADLDGGEPGRPLDVVRVFGEMIQLNGGRPLRCHA